MQILRKYKSQILVMRLNVPDPSGHEVDCLPVRLRLASTGITLVGTGGVGVTVRIRVRICAIHLASPGGVATENSVLLPFDDIVRHSTNDLSKIVREIIVIEKYITKCYNSGQYNIRQILLINIVIDNYYLAIYKL